MQKTLTAFLPESFDSRGSVRPSDLGDVCLPIVANRKYWRKIKNTEQIVWPFQLEMALLEGTEYTLDDTESISLTAFCHFVS